MRMIGWLILTTAGIVSCGARDGLDVVAGLAAGSGGDRGAPSVGKGGAGKGGASGTSATLDSGQPFDSGRAGSSVGGSGVVIVDAMSFDAQLPTDARDAFSSDEGRDGPRGDVAVVDAIAPPSTWIKRFGGNVDQFANALGVQPDGTLFVGGSFNGDLDFGDGQRSSILASVDAFVASFDTDGGIRWSKQFGDSGTQVIHGAAAIAAGGVALIGGFSGEIDFGGGPLPGGGNYDLFVSRLDDQGRYVSGVRFGNNANQYGQAVAVTSALKIVATGRFVGNLDPVTSVVSAGSTDVFFLGFNSSADRLWAKSFGNALPQAGWSIATHPNGSVVIVGEFGGQIDFGLGNLTTAGDNDAFVAYFDAGGNIVWAKRFGSIGDQTALGVAVDGTTNRIAITGSFVNDLDFGCGVMQTTFPSAYLTLLDTDGNCKVSIEWAGASTATARAITFTPQHTAIVVAESYQPPDDAGPTGSWPVVLGITDANFTRATPFAAWTSGGGFQSPNAIGVDAAGNLYIAGTFTKWIELGGQHLVALGAHDIFLAKVQAGTF